MGDMHKYSSLKCTLIWYVGSECAVTAIKWDVFENSQQIGAFRDPASGASAAVCMNTCALDLNCVAIDWDQGSPIQIGAAGSTILRLDTETLVARRESVTSTFIVPVAVRLSSQIKYMRLLTFRNLA